MKHFSKDEPFVIFEKPPFCPNSECFWHHTEAATEASFAKQGKRPVSRFPYVTRRFLCKRCGKTFSDSIFFLFYRDRTEPTYHEIFHYHCRGESRRDLARDLGCTIATVQRRFRKLASQALLQQTSRMRGRKVSESIAFDGIENFSGSQFEPNNVNHAVGRDTLFLYDFNFAPLNRRGRKTASQKKKEKKLDEQHGRFPTNSLRTTARRLIERMLGLSNGVLELYTDGHYAYKEAISLIPEKHRIDHRCTSSRKARNYQNPLFAINHVDMLARHRSAVFKRETIAFAKNSIGMLESFAILMVNKNFLRPMFTKAQVRNPRAHLDSPAVAAGVEQRVLTFGEFYGLRVMPTQVRLSEDWRNIVERRDETSRRRIRAA